MSFTYEQSSIWLTNFSGGYIRDLHVISINLKHKCLYFIFFTFEKYLRCFRLPYVALHVVCFHKWMASYVLSPGGTQTVPFCQMKSFLIVAPLADDILQILYYEANMVLNTSICGSAMSCNFKCILYCICSCEES